MAAAQTIFFFCFFFAAILLLLKIGKNKKADTTSTSKIPLPPGPWRLPIIGNIPHLLGSLPHRKLRDLAKKYGALMHVQLGEVSAIVVSSPQYAKEVMKTHDVTFASRPRIIATDILAYGSTNIAFSPYGDYWRQLRKICSLELLSQKRVQSFSPIRKEEVSNLLNWIGSEEGQVINLTEATFSLIYTITSRAAFGKKRRETEEFIEVITQGVEFASGFVVADLFPSIKWLHLLSGLRAKLEKLHKRSDRLLENIIDDHKRIKANSGTAEAEAEENLINVLLKFEDVSSDNLGFRLTKDNIKAVVLDVISAGSETSATTLNWAIAEMMKDPRVLRKAQVEVREVFDRRGKVDESGLVELNYLRSVVKETLRLHPAAPLLLPRECGEACEINGYQIPEKFKVIVNAWAIGRDPEYWNEPEKFNPERFFDNSIDYKDHNFEFIPFGGGRRICPGMTYGLINVEFPLAMMLYHFDWKLPKGVKNEELDMTEHFGTTVRRKDDLFVIPYVCHPLPLS